MSDERFAYIGFGPCGCGWFIAVDCADTAGEVAKETRSLMKVGGRMERHPLPGATNLLTIGGRDLCRPKRKERQAAFV